MDSIWSNLDKVVQVFTLIAIVFAAWQILFHARQMHRDLEMTYVLQYWKIIGKTSLAWRKTYFSGEPVTDDDEFAILQYLQLCEDELDLRRNARVTDSTWSIWAVAIYGTMQKKADAIVCSNPQAVIEYRKRCDEISRGEQRLGEEVLDALLGLELERADFVRRKRHHHFDAVGALRLHADVEHALRVHARHHVLDRAVLARRIHRLEHAQQRPSGIGVEQRLQLRQPRHGGFQQRLPLRLPLSLSHIQSLPSPPLHSPTPSPSLSPSITFCYFLLWPCPCLRIALFLAYVPCHHFLLVLLSYPFTA
jgi:hypothetical protein